MSCTKNPQYWSPEEKARVAELLKEGLSAGKICKHFGVTRNAICGLVARDETLKVIGLRGGHAGGKKRRLTDDQRKENARRSAREYYHRAKKPASKSQRIVPPREVPKLSLVTSVEEWLKENGGPRKFERGFSTDYYSIRQYLAERGVRIENHQNRLKLYEGGRPKIVSWDVVHSIVDEFRIADGLTPILREDAA